MTTTSANINDLLDYINDLSTGTGETFGTTFDAACTKHGAVFAACQSSGDGLGFQVPDSPGLVALGQLYETWSRNVNWVNGIRTALIEADNYDEDGNATAPTATIQDYLERNQLDVEPTNIEVGEVTLYGQPPYSGMIDDPINAATGNYTDLAVDLDMPGRTREIAVARTYNSKAASSEGVFGSGWSSLLDAHLRVDERHVSFVLPDGGTAHFPADGDGGYAPDRRRHMWLHETADGWQVRLHHNSTWTFDHDGVLVQADTPGTAVTIERSDRLVTVTEARSGRVVRYHRNPDNGRVVRIETSDGRTAHYRYNGAGHLVRVERPSGTVHYEVDDAGLVLSVTDADGVVICRNTYDRWGRVLTQVEAHGRETTYHYERGGVFRVTAADDAPPNVMVHDRRGRMTAMIDGLGHAQRLSYDEDDNLVRVVNRGGGVIEYDYDDRGNMTRRRDPDDIDVHITYDDRDRPVEIIDRSGGTWRFGYVGDGDTPTSVTQPDGSSARVDVDAAGMPTSITDADGVTLGMEWTVDGQVAALLDGAGGETRFFYDDAGNLVSQVDPLGRVGEWNLDLAGRILSWTGPLGAEERTYTPGGRLVSEITANGDAWQAELDATGEIASLTTVTGSTVSYERDSVGRVTAVLHDGVAVKTFEYDPLGRLTVVGDALGGRITRGYDPDGNLTSVTDATGSTLLRNVDVMGRTQSMTSPSGEVVARRYHPGGQLSAVTDAAGRTWRFDVDALGRRTAVHDPVGNTTRYEYSPAGRLLREITPLGRITEYDYDSAGRLVRIDHASGSTVEFEHAANGAVTAAHRSENGVVRTVDLSYGESGRLASVASTAGSLATVERGGEVTSVTRNGATSVLNRAPGGRLVGAVDPAGIETTFTHDGFGHLTGHRTGGSSTVYGHDLTGRVTSMTDPYGAVTGFGRDARGAVIGVEYADGSEVRYAIGANGAIDALYDGDDDLLLGFDRDPNGRIVASRGPAGTTEFTLDERGLLAGVSGPGGRLIVDWDADYRRTGWRDDTGFAVSIDLDEPDASRRYRVQVPGLDERVLGAPNPLARTFDVHGRISVDEDGRRYTYDGAGRLASSVDGDTTRTFHYDAAGMLASEAGPSGDTAYDYGAAGEIVARRMSTTETTYVYDERGRRVSEAGSDGTSVDYRWDALGRLVGYTMVGADGSVTERELAYSTASRPSRIDDVPILWDAAGTSALLGIGDRRFLWHGAHVLEATDPQAAWSRRLADDPYGHDGGTGIRLGYRGSLACDRFILLGDRVYDPATRQFLSRDPLAGVPGRLDFAAPYNYCYSDPVNYVDPSGRRPLSDEEFSHSQEGWGTRAAAATVDFVKDNWKTIAIVVGSVVLGALLTPVVGPIAAGAIAGAVGNAGITAVNGGSPGDIVKSAVIGGITGAFGGAIVSRFAQPATMLTRAGPLAPSTAANTGTRLAQNATNQAVAAFPGAVLGEGLDSYTTFPGASDPDGNFEWNKVAQEVVYTTVGGTLVDEVTFRAENPTPSNNGNGNGNGSGTTGGQPEPAPLNGPDVDLPSPDPVPDTSPGGNTGTPPVTREQLTDIHGIGDVTATNVLDYIAEHGVPDDLTDIPGVGEHRAELLSGVL